MAFHYTRAVEEAVALIVRECPLFGHVRVDEVAVSFAQTKSRSRYGNYAKMVPLRFEGGKTEVVERGRRFRADPFSFRGKDVLYILYVYLPRFHDQGFEDKVLTLFHELFHIGPAFDGDLRRLPGPNPFHGASREEYDRNLRPYGAEFLDRCGSAPELDFLREPLAALERRHGGVAGTWIQQPSFPAVDR